MLRWRVKPDVADVRSAYGHAEGLNGPIEVLVIERVLIVPDASRGVCDFVTHEPDPIVAWIRFDLVYGCARPSVNGWLLSHGGANRAKTEIRRAATHAMLLVGNVVIHVALARVTLAPGVFMRDHILRFGEIGGARILRQDQVTRLNQYPVRRYVMTVAAVIVRCET
jgi:hypothetical protein